MNRSMLPFFLVALSLSIPLRSATIVVKPGSPISTNSVTSSVTGADLTGLIVTEIYEEPTGPLTLTSTWTPTGSTSGEANAGPSSVSVTGNASAPLAWTYRSIVLGPLISIELDGTAAGIFFDRAHSGPGTPGSGTGADLTFGPIPPSTMFPSNTDSAIVITYSNVVSLDGNPPQNDLYAKLSINFAGVAPFGGLQPEDFAFTQPVDRAVTPEVSSVSMVVTAFMVLVVFRIKKLGRQRSIE